MQLLAKDIATKGVVESPKRVGNSKAAGSDGNRPASKRQLVEIVAQAPSRQLVIRGGQITKELGRMYLISCVQGRGQGQDWQLRTYQSKLLNAQIMWRILY